MMISNKSPRAKRHEDAMGKSGNDDDNDPRPLSNQRKFQANNSNKVKMRSKSNHHHDECSLQQLFARPSIIHMEPRASPRAAKRQRRQSVINSIIMLIQIMIFFSPPSDSPPTRWLRMAQAVSVQRLQVPDLVVIDQLQLQQQQQRQQSYPSMMRPSSHLQQAPKTATSQEDEPEAASLINNNNNNNNQDAFQQQQQQITFECLVSFDRRKDKNLIVKWHHDERNEPIYQWIPELNKRSVAPQYRAFIVPIVAQPPPPPGRQQLTTASAAAAAGSLESTSTNTTQSPSSLSTPPISASATSVSQHQSANTTTTQANHIQLLEAGFRLIRPTKELGGKYTCSAISSQNDDSKSKKMIVYTPPKSFRFNASRTDIGVLLASQRDRLIQLTQPAPSLFSQQQQQSQFAGATNQAQLPLAYRMRGLVDQQQQQMTTIMPQMYSTIDYVNVNQQRSRPPPSLTVTANGGGGGTTTGWLVNSQQSRLQQQQQQQVVASGRPHKQQLGIKLVCDIDQVFPVPEVSIYRLAKLDGSHPEKLAKLDTKIERDPYTSLFHVQVTSILDDDELQSIRQNYLMSSTPPPPASELEVYFECLIALTNLELSKHADNKRSIIYRPGQQQQLQLQQQLQQQQQQLTNSLQMGSHESDLSRSTLEQFGSSRASGSPLAVLVQLETFHLALQLATCCVLAMVIHCL